MLRTLNSLLACRPGRAEYLSTKDIKEEGDERQKAIDDFNKKRITMFNRFLGYIPTECHLSSNKGSKEFFKVRFPTMRSNELVFCVFDVLNKLQLVENDLGRTRVNVNEPRSIDLDLIDFSGKVVNTKNLILPHPRAHLRKFVMEPIAELEPMWIHPINKLSAKFLSNELNNQIIMIYDKYKNFD